MTPATGVVYLHGFASSPASSKAERFKRELAARGVAFACPDLNRPAFETLTVTRMLGAIDQACQVMSKATTALVGSSLGGFLALHAAERPAAAAVDRLILLAPAVEFGGNRLNRLGEHRLDEWRRMGYVRVFHYGDGIERTVGYGLYEDAAGYDAFSVGRLRPTLVFQGTEDDTVDPEAVTRWAAGRPNVTVRLLPDGHQLTASMDRIWAESAEFLGLDGGR